MTSPAPLRVIINENKSYEPSFRPIASRMAERNWGGVIINDITLGLEARCRIIPPRKMYKRKVATFPESFDRKLDKIIASIPSRTIKSVFRDGPPRQRLPTRFVGDDKSDMRMSQCRGFDRLWRIPIQTYKSPEELFKEILVMRLRIAPYLLAYSNQGWTANLHPIIYTDAPETKPNWFADFEYAHWLEWDAQPWIMTYE